MKMSNNSKKQGVQKIVINWYPGHMAKTKRQVKENLKFVDIIYEVIDARMPMSSKIVDIDEWTRGKPKILIMTKYDLCDKTQTNKFIKYYENKGYTVIPLDLVHDKVTKVIDASQEILKEEQEKRIKKGLKPRSIRALIVGVPNVGKSTLINRLVGRKSAQIGNRPGVTKNLSWIRINKDIELLDSPGVLWPKLTDQEGARVLAALSSIKEEILNIDDLAIFVLKKMHELYPEQLKNRYGIEELDEDFIDTYEMIAKKRGALARGGVADYEKVSNIIVRDLKDGYLGNITLDRLKEED